MAARLGSDFTYDQLQDLAGNHRNLRAIMGLGDCDETADEEFLAAKQNHSGVESTIGALQSGNAMKRCRDRSEIGFERYV